jgi:hypothetical protein
LGVQASSLDQPKNCSVVCSVQSTGLPVLSHVACLMHAVAMLACGRPDKDDPQVVPHVVYRATRRIQAGEELLLDWGPECWLRLAQMSVGND